MFTLNTDFDCSSLHNVYICKAKLPTATSTFIELQTRVRDVSALMAKARLDVPPTLTTLVVDGRPGPTTALGAQMVVAAFNRTVPVPAELAPLISGEPLPGNELITLVARQAPEIVAYINDVIKNHPNALQALIVERIQQQIVNPISLKSVAMVAGGALLIIGGVYAFRKMERQREGLEDQSHFLPDAPDEDGDDDEGEGEGDEHELAAPSTTAPKKGDLFDNFGQTWRVIKVRRDGSFDMARPSTDQFGKTVMVDHRSFKPGDIAHMRPHA